MSEVQIFSDPQPKIPNLTLCILSAPGSLTSDKLHPIISIIMAGIEDQALFSRERAFRGAKTGDLVAAGFLGIGLTITGIVSPGELGEVVGFIYEHPNENITALGIIFGFSAGVGAAIDSFKPTSRLATREIKRNVDTFLKVKNGLTAAYEYLKYFDYSQIPYNLSARDLPKDAIGKLFAKSAFIGTVDFALLWGTSKLLEVAKQGVGWSSSSFFATIADHPVETIITGAALGLATATGILAFRPDRQVD